MEFKGIKIEQYVESAEKLECKSVKWGDSSYTVTHHEGTLGQIYADRDLIRASYELLKVSKMVINTFEELNLPKDNSCYKEALYVIGKYNL